MDMRVRKYEDLKRVFLIKCAGIGEVIEHGPGVSLPPLGSKVGIKYTAEACLNCGTFLLPNGRSNF